MSLNFFAPVSVSFAKRAAVNSHATRDRYLDGDRNTNTVEDVEDALRNEQVLDHLACLLERHAFRVSEELPLGTRFALVTESEHTGDDDCGEVGAAAIAVTTATADNEGREDCANEEETGQDCVDEEDDGIKLENYGPLGVNEIDLAF